MRGEGSGEGELYRKTDRGRGGGESLNKKAAPSSRFLELSADRTAAAAAAAGEKHKSAGKKLRPGLD